MNAKHERIIGIAVFAIALAIASWLRLRNLDLKPLHSDEGVNGWFLMSLYNNIPKWMIKYKYDPTNYHGPFLYFAGLVPFALLGASSATLRLLPAIAGIGCIGILWPIRKWLGWAGLAAASFLFALSPPFVYFSRTAIHEIYVVFFSLAAVVCFVRAFAGTGTGAPDAPRWNRNWLLWAFVCCALLFTNKETAIITFASFLGAAAIAWLFATTRGNEMRVKRETPTLVTWIGAAAILAGTLGVAWVFVKGKSALSPNLLGETERHFSIVVFLGVACAAAWFFSTRDETFHFVSRVRRFADLKPKTKEEWSDFGLALAWAAAITVILFTSFFNNPRGAWDMFATYGTWVGRGHQGAGHEKPFTYWLELLWEFDAPLLVLAIVGTVAAMFRRDRFSLFIAAWAWSQWLVYSVISYKTPWLNLNFTGPMCVLGGIALRELTLRIPRIEGRVAVVAVVPIALALWPVPAGPVLSPENPEEATTWWRLGDDINFGHYDDDRYKIIYVQTVRDFETMVGKIEKMFSHHGESLNVWVTSGDYWPLPFYLREHDKTVGYHQGKIPSGTPASVIVSSSTQDAELRPKLVGWRQEQFMLRPGVVVSLWVEPAVWDPVFGPPVDGEAPAPAPEDTARLQSGLVAEYRYGIGCTGEVLARRVEPEPTYGSTAGKDREFRAPVCVRWRGFLKIAQSDDYAFRTQSDDGSWVYVGGQLALDNGGAHGPLPLAGVLRRLEAGLHPIEVRYFDAGGGAMLDVKIRRRGAPEESLAGLVVHDPAMLATPGGT